MLAVWIAAGARLGGAFHRSGLYRLALIPLVPAAVTAIETDPATWRIVRDVPIRKQAA